jgi:hypothetical protein
MGQQKLREAQAWWESWARAIHKYRCWAVVFISRQYALHRLDQIYGKSETVAQATNLINARNAAHDFMLIADEAARASSACAVACENMARTYFEDYENREELGALDYEEDDLYA